MKVGTILPLNLSVKLNSSWLGLFVAGIIGVTVDSAAIACLMSTSGPISYHEASTRTMITTTMRLKVHKADDTASASRLKCLLLLFTRLFIQWMRLRGR